MFGHNRMTVAVLQQKDKMILSKLNVDFCLAQNSISPR